MDTERLIEEYKKIMFVEEEEATRVDSLAIADLSFEIHEETEVPFDELIEYCNGNQDIFDSVDTFVAFLGTIKDGEIQEKDEPNTPDKIKLVIWDLDETFWNGTLSEDSDVEVNHLFEAYLKKLVDRGVMNSICSKNDFDTARSKLEELGLWELFVFPSIDWSGKGPRVKQLIEDMQLREQNVIFVDDNHGNIEEVLYFSPDIGGLYFPENVEPLLERAISEGKDDSSHSRLNQYKVLERKHVERTGFKDNEEFLRQSDIKIKLVKNWKEFVGRILELVTRTNQLNFTKVRSDEEELMEQFITHDIYLLEVSDKFGGYGVVGFVAVYEGKATHFVFSCRVLGMGVESFMYQWLNKPEIEFAEPLAYELDVNQKADWITLEQE